MDLKEMFDIYDLQLNWHPTIRNDFYRIVCFYYPDYYYQIDCFVIFLVKKNVYM